MRTHDNHSRRKAKDNIIKITRQRLKIGESFYLGTSNKTYWRNVIERDLTGCTIEDWDEGLVIRRG